MSQLTVKMSLSVGLPQYLEREGHRNGKVTDRLRCIEDIMTFPHMVCAMAFSLRDQLHNVSWMV